MTTLKDAAPARSPVFTVARAAVAHSFGGESHAGDLLNQASEEDHAAPSYYGAAWVALGRLLLQTDLLGRCSGRP
jgi:endoglucanase